MKFSKIISLLVLLLFVRVYSQNNCIWRGEVRHLSDVIIEPSLNRIRIDSVNSKPGCYTTIYGPVVVIIEDKS